MSVPGNVFHSIYSPIESYRKLHQFGREYRDPVECRCATKISDTLAFNLRGNITKLRGDITAICFNLNQCNTKTYFTGVVI